MSSSQILTNSKISEKLSNKTKSITYKQEDLMMDSSLAAANSCTTLKPNLLAMSSGTHIGASDTCCSRLTSTMSSSFGTVLPTQTLYDCTSSHFMLSAFRTSSKAKFCATVLILLGAIAVRSSHAIPTPTSGYRLILHTQQYRQTKHQQLLQQQRSLVSPTPHHHNLHHRAVRNMDRPEKCQVMTKKLEDCIRDALRQANNTFYDLYHKLGSYTTAYYNETPEHFYDMWSMHRLDLNHAYAKYLENIRGLNITPEHITSDKIHLNGQPLTKEMLHKEFQLINQTLKSLEDLYNYVSQNRNISLLTNELGNARVDAINKYFQDASDNLNENLSFSAQITKELEIVTPIKETTWNKQIQNIEMHLFKEHMAVMKYLVGIYTYILRECELKI